LRRYLELEIELTLRDLENNFEAKEIWSVAHEGLKQRERVLVCSQLDSWWRGKTLPPYLVRRYLLRWE